MKDTKCLEQPSMAVGGLRNALICLFCLESLEKFIAFYLQWMCEYSRCQI